MLVEACTNNMTHVVKLLLAAGANVHAYDDFKVRWVSGNGHTEVVKLLLAAGADVHTNFHEALWWANKYGHTAVVNLLTRSIVC